MSDVKSIKSEHMVYKQIGLTANEWNWLVLNFGGTCNDQIRRLVQMAIQVSPSGPTNFQ